MLTAFPSIANESSEDNTIITDNTYIENDMDGKVVPYVNLSEIKEMKGYVKISVEVNLGDSISWELITEDEMAKIYTDATCKTELNANDNVTTVYVKGEPGKACTVNAYSNLDKTVYVTCSFIIPKTDVIKYIVALIGGLVVLLLIAFYLFNRKRIVSIIVTLLLLPIVSINSIADGITVTKDTDLRSLEYTVEDIHITSDLDFGDRLRGIFYGNVFIENNSTVKGPYGGISISKDLIIEDGSTLHFKNAKVINIDGDLIIEDSSTLHVENVEFIDIGGDLIIKDGSTLHVENAKVIDIGGDLIIEDSSTLHVENADIIDIDGDLIIEDGSTLFAKSLEILDIRRDLIVYPKGRLETNAKYMSVNGDIYLYNKAGFLVNDSCRCSCESILSDPKQFDKVSSNFEIPFSYAPDIRISEINIPKDNSAIEISAQYKENFLIKDNYAFNDKLIWTAESAGNHVELYSDEECTTKLDATPTDLKTVYIKAGKNFDCIVKATSYYDDTQNASCNISIK